jgi:hypothetical protein
MNATDLSTKQWSLTFQTGGPMLPQNLTLKKLDFWTNTTDTTAQFFLEQPYIRPNSNGKRVLQAIFLIWVKWQKVPKYL